MITMKENERLPVDTDLLQTFLIVAEAENVTRAADRLGRTQSAVSVQIRKLETALSIRLFERQARGMALTEAGETLAPAARQVLAALDRVGALFSQPLSGRIRVGIPDDYGVAILEKVLATFAARHPAVEVSVRCGFSVGFPEAIRSNELDMAVHTADPKSNDGEPLLTDRTVWVASQSFRSDDGAPAPLALFDRACWWRDAAIDAMERAGRPYRIAYSSESVAGVKAAIGAGLAIGVLAESTVEPSMRLLTERDGFPDLPPSSLVILRSKEADVDILDAMESALRFAMQE